MRLIDIDALIAKCGDWYTEEGTEEGFIGTIRALVDEQPTIESERWIPCNERLPEDIEDTYPVVIICGDFGVSVGFYGEYVDGDRYWYDMGNDIERSTVKAWMPLPEPWKGEEHDRLVSI